MIDTSLSYIYLFKRMKFDYFKFEISWFQWLKNKYVKYTSSCGFVVVGTINQFSEVESLILNNNNKYQ
jgi:hypothetical protein